MDNKHFIDSSVAQKQLFGIEEYRLFLKKRIGLGPQYISDFVLMEFRRTFIKNAIHFCQLLDNPIYKSIGEVLDVWSDKFSKSEHKAVLRLMSRIVDSEKFSHVLATDLPKFRLSVVEIIKQLDRQFRGQYIHIFPSRTSCSRAHVAFDIHLETYQDDFEKFLKAFDDVETRLSRCDISKFLLHIKSKETEKYINANKTTYLKKTVKNKNFKGVATQLEKIKEKSSAASCRLCGSMGDAVIALDCPSDMILQHTDTSFDQLCDLIGQDHQLIPSQTKVINMLLQQRGENPLKEEEEE